jgi:hypothetical protein
VFHASLRRYDPHEQRQIMHDVAAHIYRIDTTREPRS